ncbi:MAG: molybdopterin-synthase adenylyltransferase MoeB [Lachnospiraceae bacterium]|nr:molybdopterin-synthase adenylyltransferase MoeB [Lachnospiraceae bacterium]
MSLITIDEVNRLEPGSYVYVDMRGDDAYAHGHIPDAINWNRREETDMLPRDKKLIVYCSIGENSIEAAEELIEQGFEAYSLKRGFREWLLTQYKGLSSEELKKYDRQIILPQIGVEGQKKLKNSKVLIIGAGGLGSPAALYLAGAGVGTIGIMDADEVGLSNLHRQIVHSVKKVGMNKAESAAEAMNELNDMVKVNVYKAYLTPDNAEEIISQYDFIIDAADNFETKFLINDACVLQHKPFCHAGVLQFMGQVMTYVPGDCPCYRCFFEEIPERRFGQTCNEAGVLGPVVGIVGCIQATEAIKYICGIEGLLTGRLLIFDGLDMEVHIVNFKSKNDSCRVCGKDRQITSVKENAAEYSGGICHI